MFAEEVGHLPEEIFILGLKAVAVAGENEHLKAFVGAYEGVYNAGCVRGVHIVVHITGYKQQVNSD